MKDEQENVIHRPMGVWVISILIFITAAWTLFSFGIVYSQVILLPPEVQQYFQSLSLGDRVLTVLIGL